MIVLLVFLVVIVAVVLIVRAANRRSDADVGHDLGVNSSAGAHGADPQLDPLLAEVLRRPDTSQEMPRGAQNALGEATPRILDSLRRHKEVPLLILWSDDIVSKGLLVVTSGRTLRIGPTTNGTDELVHPGASTSIRATGPRDLKPTVEVVNRGRIRFVCSSLTEAQLLCGVIDTWAENPGIAADPRVVVTPRTVRLPEEFYVDMLRAAGHEPTAYNMRSLHERVGMQLHHKAVNHLTAAFDEATVERYIARAGRPRDDRDLPQWPEQVLKQWIALSPDVAHVAAFTPHLARSILLETARSGGYLAPTGAPLSMWQSDEYENDGRGERRRVGPGQPPVSA